MADERDCKKCPVHNLTVESFAQRIDRVEKDRKADMTIMFKRLDKMKDCIDMKSNKVDVEHTLTTMREQHEHDVNEVKDEQKFQRRLQLSTLATAVLTLIGIVLTVVVPHIIK